MSSDRTEEEIARLEDDLANWHAVETVEDIRALPADAQKLYATLLDDVKVRAIVAHAPEATSIWTDGNNLVSDEGVRDLARLENLSELDLEWSAVTDAALPWLAQIKTLAWVDLGFTKVTPPAVQKLQASRPDLSIDYCPSPLA